MGKTTFYQSLFIGGHENLLGYRQFRFAGQHSVYNNLEARVRLFNFRGYVIPGEFGLLGFYDIGRVWEKGENSSEWHNGTGAGLYFAPAKLAVLSAVMGHSSEGWYPYITLGFRF
jgi:hemolysin activation/secretion protein